MWCGIRAKRPVPQPWLACATAAAIQNSIALLLADSFVQAPCGTLRIPRGLIIAMITFPTHPELAPHPPPHGSFSFQHDLSVTTFRQHELSALRSSHLSLTSPSRPPNSLTHSPSSVRTQPTHARVAPPPPPDLPQGFAAERRPRPRRRPPTGSRRRGCAGIDRRRLVLRGGRRPLPGGGHCLHMDASGRPLVFRILVADLFGVLVLLTMIHLTRVKLYVKVPAYALRPK